MVTNNGIRKHYGAMVCVSPLPDERTCPMADTKDLWYIRLPDGKVLRAAGASVIRQQLAAGRLPAGTRVRRSLEEDWRAVERIPEFSDAAHPPGVNGTAGPTTIASRLDPSQVGTAGLR